MNIVILKINEGDGSKIWKKTYYGNSYEYDHANAIIEDSDGNLVVAGYRYIDYGSNHDYWILKLNNTGNKIWEKTYGGSKYDDANSIIETADGNLVVAGRTESKGAGRADYWILKLNKTGGNIIWEKTHGGSDWDNARSIIETADGNLVVAGNTSSKGAGSANFWILKLNNTGNKILGKNPWRW